jgi:hypothetical protein
MTLGRAATLIALLAIPAALWGFLNGAKNDVLEINRSLIGQVQAVREKARQESDPIAAEEHYGKAQARFYIRFRYPEGNPDRQQMMLESLFHLLGSCDPETARYGEDEPRKTEDGLSHNHRQVLVEGKNSDGERATLALEWVQFRGSWYIDDYQVLDPGNGTSATNHGGCGRSPRAGA